MATDKSSQAGSCLTILLDDSPPRAAAFIVTIYGDVVEPRGGATWIGNLIEICAAVGISETLVRTAVSRLVSAGQLSGEREGRRSFYRLAAPARAEFAAAASLLFGPPEMPDWHFVQLTGPSPDETMQKLERAGHARLGPRLAVGARPLPRIPEAAVVFRAEIVSGEAVLGDFAADHWDLAPHIEAYRSFLARFGRFSACLAASMPLSPADCLVARLLLVHEYRLALLRDPRLPRTALPEDWPGEEARRLFVQLYLQLSARADRHVAHSFLTADGALAEVTDATSQRLVSLHAGA